MLKSRLSETQGWLLTQPESEDRIVCLSLVYELDKLDLSDLPQTNRGDEYGAYTEALEAGLDDEDQSRREFFLISSIHFGYIEHLLNRIGLVSIRQIITKRFIDTLAKGVGLVGISVMTLIASTLWYNEYFKRWFVLIAAFLGISTALLLIEVWVHMRRNYEEELDFVEHDDNSNQKAGTVGGGRK